MTMTPTQARERIEALALERSGLGRPSHDPAKYAETLRAVMSEPEGARLYTISTGRRPSDPLTPAFVNKATAVLDEKARAAQRPDEAYSDALSRVIRSSPELYTESLGPRRGN